MSISPDSNARIIELEMHVAHLSRLFDELNQVVTEQAMRQDRLQMTVRQLQEKVKEFKMEQETNGDPLDEKPPHY